MTDITLKKRFNYSSNLYRFLCQYPEKDLYYNQHNPILEHPADALRKSLNNCYNALKKLSDIDKENSDDCKECIKNVFNHLDSFYDITFEILKSFYNPNGKTVNKDNKVWLKENKIHCVNKYTSSVDTYSNFVADINNLTKHNTWNFIPFKLSYNNNSNIYSFYFGTNLHDNAIGPNQTIHKKWKGFQTGFSYNFIIRKLIAQIFLYQEKLYVCLKSDFSSFRMKDNDVNDGGVNKKLFELAFNTPIIFLPNEYELTSGKLTKLNDNYFIQFPRNYLDVSPKIQNWSVNCNLQSNPRTNMMKGVLPYFQNIKPR